MVKLKKVKLQQSKVNEKFDIIPLVLPFRISGGISISHKNSASGFSRLRGLFKRKKSTTKMVQEYMEFYYPTTGKIRYEIIFDWGEYIITTEDKTGAEVSDDSKPYLGFITFRPEVAKKSSETNLSFYLITPNGEVWENETGHGIPEISERIEVTKKKTEFGTSTQTHIIRSGSEPIIDHFKAHPKEWNRYGKLETRGNITNLNLIKR